MKCEIRNSCVLRVQMVRVGSWNGTSWRATRYRAWVRYSNHLAQKEFVQNR